MLTPDVMHRLRTIASPIDRAFYLVSVLHAGQKDKMQEPYIWHLIRVAQTFAGADDFLTVVALLHDVVEDTPAELLDIAYWFGPEIADAVDSVTDRKAEGETYFEFVARSGRHPKGALVKRADLMDHFRPGATESMRKRYTKALYILDEAMHS